VNAAYEALRLPGGLAEARRMLEARGRGVQFVSERDHITARVAFRRGEMLWRNRDWKGADAQFQDAWRLDPQAWPHGLYHAHAGWLAKRLGAAEAVKLLEALQPAEPPRQAEVSFVLGSILKMDGRLDEALARFREAVQKDPNNHEAQREIRLHERRNAPKAPPTPGILDSILKRRGGGSS
jgi:tetratricopeptide (TPR) repeat protein